MKKYLYGKPAKNTDVPLIQKAVLEMHLGLAQFTKKKYTFPTQGKQLELLRKWQRISISRSTLNRALGWLVENKYLERVRRHRAVMKYTGYGKDGHMLPCSTLYHFGQKTFNYLRRLGKNVMDFFSHFDLPGWEKKRIKEGKSAFMGSIRKALATQLLAEVAVKAALGLRL